MLVLGILRTFNILTSFGLQTISNRAPHDIIKAMFTQEVKEALWPMAPRKSLDPNRLSADSRGPIIPLHGIPHSAVK